MGEHNEMAEAVAALWQENSHHGRSSEAIYRTLREAILSKALLPEQLFSEEDLTKVFGVSRTPIREAVLRLTGDHLVVRRGRRLAVSTISPAEVLEIYDVRGALDALAARLATTEATPPEVAQLRWLNEQMQEAVLSENAAESFRLNLEFHDYLARMSKNTFLLSQVRVVQDRVRRFASTTFAFVGRPDNIIIEHTAILDAIEARDPDAAAAAAAAHIMQSKGIRLEMLDD